MLVSNSQKSSINADPARLELYDLITEGYRAMNDGHTSPISEVRELIEKRRKERG